MADAVPLVRLDPFGRVIPQPPAPPKPLPSAEPGEPSHITELRRRKFRK